MRDANGYRPPSLNGYIFAGLLIPLLIIGAMIVHCVP
jgi:hypothetical protein